jgi:predicted HTH transcriptional regulator
MSEPITLKHVCAVLDYVGQHNAITNRECRIATGLGYDSAIKMFGALCAVGILKKTGETSGTKYVAQHMKKPSTCEITVEHLATVMDYVVKHGSITDRKCRDATGVTYNSTIRIFGALCSLGLLRKIGKASATQYVVAHIRTSVPLHPGYHHKKR